MILSRRQFIGAGGLMLAGLGQQGGAKAGASLVTINMRSDPDGAKVWFDPIGVLVAPGSTISWVIRENVHTVTAYHPQNDRHSLRIPKAAKPWDSGYLVNPGDHFEVTLHEPGVYDYYCTPHEEAGMVGRIIVGQPADPGSLPFDYFKRQTTADKKDWRPVPEAAIRAFPAIKQIMAKKVIRSGGPRT